MSGMCHGRNPATTNDLLTVVKDGRLTGRRCPRCFVEDYFPLTARGPGHRPGHRRRPMANAHRRPERLSRRVARDERGGLEGKLAPVQILAPAERDDVRGSVDRRDVARLPQRDTQALPLSDRVSSRAAMLADDRAVA